MLLDLFGSSFVASVEPRLGLRKISMLDDCDQGSFSQLARFAARRKASEALNKTYCITTSSDGDLLVPGRCDKAFEVPATDQKGLRICVGTRQGKAVLGLDEPSD